MIVEVLSYALVLLAVAALVAGIRRLGAIEGPDRSAAILAEAGRLLDLQPSARRWQGRLDGRTVRLQARRRTRPGRPDRPLARDPFHEVVVDGVAGRPEQEFHIAGEDLVSALGQRLLLVDDLRIGEPRLDRKFVFKVADEHDFLRLLDVEVRQDLEALPRRIEIAFEADPGRLVFKHCGRSLSRRPIVEALAVAAGLLLHLARRIEGCAGEPSGAGRPAPALGPILSEVGYQPGRPIRIRAASEWSLGLALTLSTILPLTVLAGGMILIDGGLLAPGAARVPLLTVLVLGLLVGFPFARILNRFELRRRAIIGPFAGGRRRAIAWSRVRRVGVGIESTWIHRGARLGLSQDLTDPGASVEACLVLETDAGHVEIPQSRLALPVGRVAALVDHFLRDPSARRTLG